MFLSFYGARAIGNEMLGLRVMKFRQDDRAQTRELQGVRGESQIWRLCDTSKLILQR
jgi:hypothetical protein